MGVDLKGSGRFSANWGGWYALLNLANEFGWSPAGCLEMDYTNLAWSHPDESSYKGERLGYNSNDGQLVTDSDAANIALALRRALSDPTNPAASSVINFGDEGDVRSVEYQVALAKQFMKDPTSIDDRLPVSFVREFLALCEKGGFRIF